MSIRSTLCTLALLALLAVPAQAQSVFDGPGRAGDRVSVEWVKPSFDVGDENPFTFFTSSLFLSGRFGVGETGRIVVELPISHAGIDDEFAGSGDDSDTQIGNPYLGFELRPNPEFLLEAGLRLPVVDSEDYSLFSEDVQSAAFGFLSNPNRPFAFAPDLLTIHALGNYVGSPGNDPAFELRLRGGPVVAIRTNDDDALLGDAGDDADLYAFLDAFGWYVGEQFDFGAGLSSRIIVTEGGSFSDKNISEFGLSAIAKLEGIEPGLTFKVPLDEDISDVVNYTFGITVRAPLN